MVPPATRSLRRRIGWFVLLYLAGLAAAGAVLYLLRYLLGFVFA
jgi:hypothetical protein